MSDGVPLSLVLEPGEYRVDWQIPTQTGEPPVTVTGELILRANYPPRATAHGKVPVEWNSHGTGMTGFPQTYEAKLVFGRLVNGPQVVLVDPVIDLFGPESAIINARCALVGSSAITPTDIEISGFALQVEGLDAVAGVAPIGGLQYPMSTDGRTYLDWKWEVHGNPDSSVTWTDDGVELRLMYDASFSMMDAYYFRVAFSPVLRADFVETQELDTVITDWVEPVRRIVSLATSRKERTTYLAVRLRNGDDDLGLFQLYGIGIHQEPYAARGNDILKITKAFFFANEETSALSLIRQWQKLTHEHHPLLETYGSTMLAPDQHPRSEFLQLIQAIEGLHGHEDKDKWATRCEDHELKREALIQDAAGHLSEENMAFLVESFPKRPRSNLDGPLSVVLKAAPIDVMPELKKTQLVADLTAANSKSLGPFSALRLARNDLAHGTRGYDSWTLREVSKILEGVVRANLARILGCPKDSQKRVQKPES